MSNIIKMGHNKATKKMRQNEAFSRFDDKKIRQNEHLDSIQFLQHNIEAALRLHIDNLVLTYGIKAVRESLNKTDLNNVIKKSKKAG